MLRRIVLAAALALGLCAPGRATTDAVVHVDAGALRGVRGWATVSYLGIPFAAPPVGALRWMPPAPVAPWHGVRDATRHAEPCATEGLGDGPRTTNEDCLYLDVYQPAAAHAGAGLPVMVFIHGGGELSGSTTIYDGMRMAEVTHAIVVMPAYRLGPFGSLALPSAGANGGTFILQDTIAALRWVRRNIAAFGGNPRDVTVSGESSGGTNTCNLVASPAAAGLFRQAIVQSGLCGRDGLFQDPSLADARAATIAYAKTLGCDGDAIDACLRAKSAGELLDAWKAASGTAYGTALLPLNLPDAFARGRVNRVPFLIGFTRNEWWPFEESLYPLDDAGLQKQFASTFGSRADAVAALYPATQFPHREYALGAAAGDSMIVCPALRAAASLAAFVPVSVYEFDDATAPEWKSLNPALPGPHPPGYAYGAGHTAELPYLYAYQSSSGPLDAAQKRLADAMIARWVAFGRATPPVWPTYTATHPVVTRIGAGGADFAPSTSVGIEHHCAFWNGP